MGTTTRRIAPTIIGAAIGSALLLGSAMPVFAATTSDAAPSGDATSLIHEDGATPHVTPLQALPTGTPIAEPVETPNPIETSVDAPSVTATETDAATPPSAEATDAGTATEPGAEPSETITPEPDLTDAPSIDPEPTMATDDSDGATGADEGTDAPLETIPAESTASGVPEEPAVPITGNTAAPIESPVLGDPMVPDEPGHGPALHGPAGTQSGAEQRIPTAPGDVFGGPQRPTAPSQLASTGGHGDVVMTLSAGLVLAALGAGFLIRRRDVEA